MGNKGGKKRASVFPVSDGIGHQVAQSILQREDSDDCSERLSDAVQRKFSPVRPAVEMNSRSPGPQRDPQQCHSC